MFSGKFFNDMAELFNIMFRSSYLKHWIYCRLFHSQVKLEGNGCHCTSPSMVVFVFLTTMVRLTAGTRLTGDKCLTTLTSKYLFSANLMLKQKLNLPLCLNFTSADENLCVELTPSQKHTKLMSTFITIKQPYAKPIRNYGASNTNA